MRVIAAIGALVITATWAGGAAAHHSFAMFDNGVQKKLVGVIKEVQWTNPHIWVQVLVKDDKTGQTAEWSIEGGSPNVLVRQGWHRSTLKAGDPVDVTIHPLKDGTNGGSLMRILVNGQPVGGPPPVAAGAPPAGAAGQVAAAPDAH
jgi:hypothetical protein